MKLNDALHAVVQATAESPKLSAVVSTATASLGVASAMEVISGALSTLALLAGIVASTVLARVHWQLYKNHVLQNKIFRQQLKELGGDPDEDEDYAKRA